MVLKYLCLWMNSFRINFLSCRNFRTTYIPYSSNKKLAREFFLLELYSEVSLMIIFIFSGLVSIEGWPKWHHTDWWYPLVVSLVGSFANFSLVKVILSPLNSQDSFGTPIKTPLTSVIIMKVSVESLVLLFFDTNYSQLYETNVILAVFFITTCFIVVCLFPRKNI